jgi:hypothetical protein
MPKRPASGSPRPPSRLAILGAAALTALSCGPREEPARKPGGAWTPIGLDEKLLKERCSSCHAFPEPATLPKWAWPDVLESMYRMLDLSEELPGDKVLGWYRRRAPDSFPLRRANPEATEGPLRVERHVLALAGSAGHHTIANVRLLDLDGDARLELIACDMSNGLVLVGRPYEIDRRRGDTGGLTVVARIPNPAHSEVVDLDRDGRRDLLVADLGSLMPGDHDRGRVVWLRALAESRFEAVPLLTGVGRVADVEPADFDGDGDLDLAVAEFGWRTTGSVTVLENRTRDWAHPVFLPIKVDDRHGAIHVPVADLDGDGRPDFLALISQEHETIAAYLSRPRPAGLAFEEHDVYRAPHPAWGYSGLGLADLDRDGDLDMLATNGDSFDNTGPKPYHGIQWFENLGPSGGVPRFAPRDRWEMMGVHRAEAADLDGDGDLDIVACALIAPPPAGEEVRLDSVLWLEQTSPGRFARHAIEVALPDHATLSVGDYDRDGDDDFAVGNFTWPDFPSKRPDWVLLYENRAR